MSGHVDETRAPPQRMGSAEYGPDYADLGQGGGRLRPAFGGWGGLSQSGRGEHLAETKPFFLTTEFAGAVAALAGLAVTAASSDSMDAGLAWPLATAIVAAFVFSRGFAKAAAPSFSWDPREDFRPSAGGGEGSSARGGAPTDDDRVASAVRHDDEEETHEMSSMTREEYGTQRGPMPGPMYGGYGRGFGMRPPMPIETKPFFLTSEFWGSVALIVGLAIAAGTSESIDARLFWTLATAITIGYVLSRGIAKSGTKSRSWDPREDLMQGARERMSRGDNS